MLYGRFTHLKQKCAYFNLATLNSSHLKSLLGLLGFIASCLQGIHWFEMLSLGAFQSVLSDLSKKGSASDDERSVMNEAVIHRLKHQQDIQTFCVRMPCLHLCLCFRPSPCWCVFLCWEFAASQRSVVTMATMENKKKTHWALFLLLLLLLLICFLCVIASNSNRCGEAVPLQRRSQLLRKNLTDRQTRSCDFIKHTHTHALSPVLSDVARPPLPAHFLSFVFPSIVGPCQHHQGNRSTALMPSPRLSVLQQLTDPHSVITNYR